MLSIDVVVAYNSRDRLRECVERLAGVSGITMIVVDNACPEKSYEVVENLPGVHVIHMPRNGGFAYGCNAGWRAGSSDYTLFLNPDALIAPEDVGRLAHELDIDATVGVVGPKTFEENGNMDWTIRRFPSLASTYAQALFLHRLVPRASWVDEVVRDPESYKRRERADWLSGSCLLVRRSVLEAIGGLDEAFFFYAEDIDLCRRVQRVAGLDVVFCPDASCVHAGGLSKPRAQLLPMLAASRLRYARRHAGPVESFFERVGIGIGEALRTIFGKGGASIRRGHLHAFGVIARGDDAYRPEWSNP